MSEMPNGNGEGKGEGEGEGEGEDTFEPKPAPRWGMGIFEGVKEALDSPNTFTVSAKGPRMMYQGFDTSGKAHRPLAESAGD